MPQRVATSWPVRPTVRYARHLAEALRAETLGGLVMLAAGVAALILANSPWSGTYEIFIKQEFGPDWFHVDVTHFASGGLLAVFFFIAGLELRHELTHGELKDPRTAVLPVFAAIAGVIAPALVFLTIGGDATGWAVPTATDIAFALAVLAITYTACPAPLRAFLLTLAVVDDLIAITVIALFYTENLRTVPLLAGLALLAGYGILRKARPWLLIPIAIAAWAFIYKSGVHATVAGVALGLLTDPHEKPGRTRSGAEQADHVLRPVSAGLCVPVFAFVSAGVSLSGDALRAVMTDRVALGVIAGLVIGKFVGVLGGAWSAVRLGLARLGDELHWPDIAAVAVLAGVGFTVSLLIGDLAYAGTPRNDRVTTAVLIASALASVIATVAFRIRVRTARLSRGQEG
jgi:NhaA family Na+:H+ antiporter